MKKKTKIGILVFVALIGGVFLWKWNKNRNEPKIDIIKTNQTNKQVQFEMAYKGMRFATTVTHGGVRKQVIKGHTFEAITVGNDLIFSIKGEDGSVLASKKVTFNG